MATSFHPEVGGDSRIHRRFLELVGATDGATAPPTD
jgi:glutamine amidotransferase PdxT